MPISRSHPMRMRLLIASASAVLVGLAVWEVRPVYLPPRPRSPESPAPSDPLAAASHLAIAAAQQGQRPPHPAATWQQAKVNWRQAIRLLEEIPPGTLAATTARQKLPLYRRNYAEVSDRLLTEQAALDHLKAAETLGWQAAVAVQSPPYSIAVWERASRKWQAAIAQLEAISPATSVVQQTQARLGVYRENDRQIRDRVATERAAQTTLKQFLDTTAYLNALPAQALSGATPEEVGTSYPDYADRVQALDTLLTEFDRQPYAATHVISPELNAAIADYHLALRLWKSYLDFRQSNEQWLHGEDFFNQLVPVSPLDRAALMDKYRIRTHANGKKVSLRFTVWEIWSHANDQLGRAQEKILNQP